MVSFRRTGLQDNRRRYSPLGMFASVDDQQTLLSETLSIPKMGTTKGGTVAPIDSACVHQSNHRIGHTKNRMRLEYFHPFRREIRSHVVVL